ncbi:hypothetical protein, partial [Pseudomonas syringae]|uniref:hypothetical protein n=1 Tax=Pseudomonas syringae TaxID=317 RepID=UPI001E5288FA
VDDRCEKSRLLREAAGGNEAAQRRSSPAGSFFGTDYSPEQKNALYVDHLVREICTSANPRHDESLTGRIS